jgi:hypothetical protein
MTCASFIFSWHWIESVNSCAQYASDIALEESFLDHWNDCTQKSGNSLVALNVGEVASKVDNSFDLAIDEVMKCMM